MKIKTPHGDFGQEDTTVVVNIDSVPTTFKMDADGNAINDASEIVYNKEQITALNSVPDKDVVLTDAQKELALEDETPTQTIARLATLDTDSNSDEIIIADEAGVETTYTLDTDGNALDKDSNIVYTVAQLKALTDDNNVLGINDIASLSGIQILNDDGTPKEYELTAEGLAQREIDIRDQAILNANQTAIDNFFNANPEIASMHKYSSTYGSLDGYTQYTDYDKVVIDEANVDSNYDIIIKAELARGNSPERAKRIADMSKTEKTLIADAKESLTYLKTTQKTAETAKETARNNEIRDAIDKENNYFGIAYDETGKETILNVDGSIYDIVVNKGIIGDIAIPKAGIIVNTTKGVKSYSRKQIYDYIAKPVKNINNVLYSQAELDDIERNSNVTNVISNHLKNLLGNDISQLVKQKSLEQKVISIKNAKTTNRIVVKTPTTKGAKKLVIPVK